MFVNILTPDGKDCVLNRDNLRQRIQMQLFRKEKTISQFFVPFLKSKLNFEHFQ